MKGSLKRLRGKEVTNNGQAGAREMKRLSKRAVELERRCIRCERREEKRRDKKASDRKFIDQLPLRRPIQKPGGRSIRLV